jgi:hypothetical protein
MTEPIPATGKPAKQSNSSKGLTQMGIKLHRKAKTPVRTQRKRGSECEVDLRRSASKAKLSVDYNLVAGATLIGNPIYARWSHAGFAPSYMVTSVLLYYRGENVKRTSATKGILVLRATHWKPIAVIAGSDSATGRRTGKASDTQRVVRSETLFRRAAQNRYLAEEVVFRDSGADGLAGPADRFVAS